MNSIIFLDIDGVLVTQKSIDYWMKVSGDIYGPDGKEMFCRKSIETLNKIIEKTNAEYVITSGWRNDVPVATMQRMFDNRGLDGKILDYVPSLGIEHDRGEEIMKWINKNGEPTSYAIIDDECKDDIHKYFPEERCVETSWISGLEERSFGKKIFTAMNKTTRVKTEASKKIF